MPERVKKKTVKKTPLRSKAAFLQRKKAAAIESPQTTNKLVDNKPKGALRIKRSYAITTLAILILLALLYLARSVFIAALVNGQPVSRLAVIRELEKQGGKQTLDGLITKALILQEARKKNITITQAEIDSELKSIEKNLEQQGQKLDQVLTLQGLSKNQLIEQIKLQKMLEKMVGKVEVSEKEVDDYITSNKESLPTDQDEKTLRSNIEKSLQQQKMNTKAQEFLENLRKGAKIENFVKY